MKIRHLFVLVMALAMVVMGISCNKEPEKKFYGKWSRIQMQYRDANNEEWTDSIATGYENISIEFRSDKTFTTYKDGETDRTGWWEYKDDYLYFHFHDEATNVAFKVDECSRKSMEWFFRSEKWHEGQVTYWREELWNWTK